MYNLQFKKHYSINIKQRFKLYLKQCSIVSITTLNRSIPTRLIVEIKIFINYILI